MPQAAEPGTIAHCRQPDPTRTPVAATAEDAAQELHSGEADAIHRPAEVAMAVHVVHGI